MCYILTVVFFIRNYIKHTLGSSYGEFIKFYYESFRKNKFKDYIKYLCFCLNISAEEAKDTLNTLSILQMKHESNASTFGARIAVSANCCFYDSILSAMAIFCGSKHGGAVVKSGEQIKEIYDKGYKVADYIEAKLQVKEPIFGYGHRVYNADDPRSIIMKTVIEKALVKSENQDFAKYFEIIEEMKLTINNNDYPLYPNVDLYAPLLYSIAKIKEEDFTALFILARVVGWSAHIVEQKDNNHLIRPRLSYIGSVKRV